MKSALLSLAALAARLLPMPVKQAIYRAGPLARLLRAGLNQAAPRGRTPVRVAAGGLSGIELELDLQAEKDYWLGTYEPELQRAVQELVEPGMVAYDVGANIGYISLLLARQVGEQGRVFAFEALPENLERLEANLRRSRMHSRVSLCAGAVIDSPRPVRFLIGPSGGMGKAEGSAGREEVHYPGKVNVTGLSLDDFVYTQDNPAPQILKMDIEGGEVLAVQGMRRLLREARPVLLIELHGPQAARAVWEAAQEASYRLCRMQPGFPPVNSLDELDWKAYVVGFGEQTPGASKSP
jgi:FkbM family methyltransferase